jgi:hypothetical protein
VACIKRSRQRSRAVVRFAEQLGEQIVAGSGGWRAAWGSWAGRCTTTPGGKVGGELCAQPLSSTASSSSVSSKAIDGLNMGVMGFLLRLPLGGFASVFQFLRRLHLKGPGGADVLPAFFAQGFVAHLAGGHARGDHHGGQQHPHPPGNEAHASASPALRYSTTR